MTRHPLGEAHTRELLRLFGFPFPAAQEETPAPQGEHKEAA